MFIIPLLKLGMVHRGQHAESPVCTHQDVHVPLLCRADYHDFHHRCLYTDSGNYSSTFTYMDW